MISASRSYQNNIEVMNTAKTPAAEDAAARPELSPTPRPENHHGRQRPDLDHAATSTAPRPRRGRARTTPTVTADRFLKLLVAQMQNQDPLNPMDNAQVTSQMAQINTVTGIDKLNTTVQGLSTPVRADAGAAGRVAGRPRRDRRRQQARASTTTGVGQGGFELASAGRRGQGRDPEPERRGRRTRSTSARRRRRAQLRLARRQRDDRASGLTFRVTATSGGVATTATALMRDRVDAVSTSGTTLQPRARRARAPCPTARSRPSTDRPAVTSRAIRKSIP